MVFAAAAYEGVHGGSRRRKGGAAAARLGEARKICNGMKIVKYLINWQSANEVLLMKPYSYID